MTAMTGVIPVWWVLAVETDGDQDAAHATGDRMAAVLAGGAQTEPHASHETTPGRWVTRIAALIAPEHADRAAARVGADVGRPAHLARTT